MAFGRRKKEADPVIEGVKDGLFPSPPAIEEAEVIEEKQWPDLGEPINQGGEPSMEALSTEGTEEQAKRTRVMLTDHWVDQETADAFEKVRAKLGAGTSIRTVTDYFFGHPARIHVNLPEPPPIESYSAKEIGSKVLPALTAALTEGL